MSSSDPNYGALGTAVDRKLGNNPVSVAVSAFSTYFPATKFVYIVDQEASRLELIALKSAEDDTNHL